MRFIHQNGDIHSKRLEQKTDRFLIGAFVFLLQKE